MEEIWRGSEENKLKEIDITTRGEGEMGLGGGGLGYGP